MHADLAEAREAYLRAIGRLLQVDEDAGIEEMDTMGTALGMIEAGANVETVIAGLRNL